MPTASELFVLLPTAVLVAGACVLLLSEVFLTSAQRGYQAAIAAASSALAFLIAVAQLSDPARAIFKGAAMADPFMVFIEAVVAAGLFLSVLVSAGFFRRHAAERGEYYALLLFAGSGMNLLAMAADLIMIFIALEVMSVAIYALAAWLRRGQRPTEAAFKYFVLGAFSSALYLYGAALAYGATGTTQIAALARAGETPTPALMGAAIALLSVGFAFKVAAVPFHMWAPDVYEGAPTPVTAFMAVGVKAAAFAAFVRVLAVAFGGTPGLVAKWAPMVAALAALTMIFGNLLALPQRNVKRMLAYSSIAHAGYLLLGLAAAGHLGAKRAAAEGILFYLAAYTFTAVGAFGTVAALERKETDLGTAWDLDRFAGLGKRRPVLAFFMAAFMLSLAGVPPTAGFMGKLFVFKAAIDADLTGLAILGMLTSAAGVYYYLRVVVYMYLRSPEPAAGPEERAPMLEWGLAIACALVVILGLGPETVAAAARRGAELLG
jgi:NADH-quinone oxidoreductase subunit N